jgi:hypothetical protein
MAATRKPTQTPKPIAKKTTPKMPGMGPTTRVASKAKPVKLPEFKMPTIAEYRSSAAYRSDNPMTYKQYVDTAKSQYDAFLKQKKATIAKRSRNR